MSDVEEVKFYSTARRSLQYSRCMKHVCQAQATYTVFFFIVVFTLTYAVHKLAV